MTTTNGAHGGISSISGERRALMERVRAEHGRDATLSPAPRQSRDEPGRLSYGQAEIWLAEQLTGASGMAAPLAMTLTGPLDVSALGRALARLVARHDSLRSVVEMFGGEPMQRALPLSEPDFVFADLTGLPPDAVEARMRGEAGRAIELSTGPMLRMRVYRLAPEVHALLVVRHHIVFDARSEEVLLRDLAGLYLAERDGRTPDLPELALQYADYAQWEPIWLSGSNLDRLRNYWLQALAQPPARLALPYDREPSGRGGAARFLTHELKPGLAERVSAVARAERVTPFMLLLTVLRVVLWRHTGQRDVLIGTPVSGRQRPELQDVIGYFLNMLVLRGDLRGDPTMRELLARERSGVLGAFDHQELPYSLLSRSLGRSVSAPLFHTTFSYEAADGRAFDFAGLSAQHFEVELTPSRAYDLEMKLEQRGERLLAHLAYHSERFEEATINALAAGYEDCLEAALDAPDRPLSALAEAAGVLAGRATAHLPAFRPAQGGWLAPDGRALPGVELNALDDTGSPVPAGAVGLLHATDPSVAQRYPDVSVRRLEDGALQLHTSLPPEPKPSGPDHAPDGPLQTAVAGLWRDLLGVEVTDVELSLFEAGGHSLTVAQLAAAIEETFGVSLSVASLFEVPTIAGQSALLEKTVMAALADVGPAEFDHIVAEIEPGSPTH